MRHNNYSLIILLSIVAPAIATELPQVADCEKPIYSLDQYESDKELLLELEIQAYKECLLNVAYGHEQSETGSQIEIRKAKRAIERIPLDWQAVWPLTNVIEIARSGGLWTKNKRAAAVSIVDDSGTHVYVVLIVPDSDFLVADITPIERGLFGKLGRADRSEYERFETKPVEWLEETDDHFLLDVRLRAWRNGQRYTVSGPVIVKVDGLVIWQ